MKDKTVFTIVPNGPLHIKGDFQLKGSDGAKLNVIEETYLCRCGGSKKQALLR